MCIVKSTTQIHLTPISFIVKIFNCFTIKQKHERDLSFDGEEDLY